MPECRSRYSNRLFIIWPPVGKNLAKYSTDWLTIDYVSKVTSKPQVYNSKLSSFAHKNYKNICLESF